MNGPTDADILAKPYDYGVEPDGGFRGDSPYAMAQQRRIDRDMGLLMGMRYTARFRVHG